MKLLCLSNGHGEDGIAVRVLQALQQHPRCPELAALPLSGTGQAYRAMDIPIVGPVRAMPSGGFIYMDQRQLAKDVRGGLIQLTFAQLRALRHWAKQGDFILAVGDIVPLLMARFSGKPYAFIGTAKSDYHLRDEAGPLPHLPWAEVMAARFGSVYYPWERWLMRHPRCQVVFPRDTITTKTLQQKGIRAVDLGNPMMDGLDLNHARLRNTYYGPDAEQRELQRSLVVLLLPGSRTPEAYANWQQILQAVESVLRTCKVRSLHCLAAIAPGLDPVVLGETLRAQGWQTETTELANSLIRDPEALQFRQGAATLVLTQQAYQECLHEADVAIAMAGTATEQFVGLGKPAVTLAGQGPQFTLTFAQAQARLLGPSVTLVQQPERVGLTMQALLQDPDRLQLIAENGRRRMGTPGAAQRIAAHLVEALL